MYMKRIIITESQLKKVKKTLLNEYRITTPRARQREYEEWLAKKEKKEKERLERTNKVKHLDQSKMCFFNYFRRKIGFFGGTDNKIIFCYPLL